MPQEPALFVDRLGHDRRVLRAGLRCIGFDRFHHRFRGSVDRSSGPLQLTWDNDGVTAFDIATDWTLEITDRPWADPFAGASPDRLGDLDGEVGIWVRAQVADDDPLVVVIGQSLLSATPERDEMGELVGVRLCFDTTTLRLFGWEGNLRAQIE